MQCPFISSMLIFAMVCSVKQIQVLLTAEMGLMHTVQAPLKSLMGLPTTLSYFGCSILKLTKIDFNMYFKRREGWKGGRKRERPAEVSHLLFCSNNC